MSTPCHNPHNPHNHNPHTHTHSPRRRCRFHAGTPWELIGCVRIVPISGILAASAFMLVGLWLLGGPIPTSLAQLEPSRPLDMKDLHAKPRLFAQRQAGLPGETIMLAIDLTIDKGWHTYWPGFNDSGFALQTKITTSPNAAAGELIWPAPHRYSPAKGLLDHVFEKHETVLMPITISPDAHLGDDVAVTIDLNWLVCEAYCLPESATVSIHLAVADAQSRPDNETAEVFDRAQARLPKPIGPDDSISVGLAGNELTIRAIGAAQLAFYPYEDSQHPRNLLADGLVQSDRLTLVFRDGDQPIRGVLEVWDQLPTTKHPTPTSHVYFIELPSAASPTASHTPSGSVE